MPNKINKGPEVYDPEALRVEYSREEREKMTRFVNGRKDSRSRYSLRILMLDILLLCIIGGVITPFIITRNKTGHINDISMALQLRSSEEEVFISLKMKNPADGGQSEAVEVEIYIDEAFQKRLDDLTPDPGEERTLRLKMKRPEEKISVKAVVKVGEDQLVLNNALGPKE